MKQRTITIGVAGAVILTVGILSINAMHRQTVAAEQSKLQASAGNSGANSGANSAANSGANSGANSAANSGANSAANSAGN